MILNLRETLFRFLSSDINIILAKRHFVIILETLIKLKAVFLSLDLFVKNALKDTRLSNGIT